MSKNYLIQCRVNQNQYERIKNLTQAKGFESIADYMRYSALDKDLTFERKFEEIQQAITVLSNKLKHQKEKAKSKFIS